jgi:hypothetical protein
MAKRNRDVFELIKLGEQHGLAEVIKDVGGQMLETGKNMFDHGRSELAAALFSGHAHVMYMHESKEGVEQTQNHIQQPEVEHDLGREM